LTPIQVDVTTDWPADLAAFARTADGAGFATGEAFRRLFAAHFPAWLPRAIVARRGGEIVGALPGYTERRMGGVWFNAMPLGTPAGPLLAPGLGAEAAPAVAALWHELDRVARREGWLGGGVTLTSPAADNEALWPPPALGRTRVDEAHVVDLSAGPVAWRAGLRKRARQQFTRAEREGVVVEVSTDFAADLPPVHALHAAQAEAWGIRHKWPIGHFVTLLAAPTTARLWVARVRGDIVCGLIGFVDPAETFTWWSGSSLAARETLAFPAMLAHIIETCGSRSVSFGFSGGPKRLTDFKEQLGAAPRPVPILELTPRPRTPYHALLRAARQALRP
jgi:hypothetical protein